VANVSNGLTKVLYTRIIVFLESSCDLRHLFCPKYDLLTATRRYVISSETLFSPVTNEPEYAKLSTFSKLTLPISVVWDLLQLAATIYLVLPSLTTNSTFYLPFQVTEELLSLMLKTCQ